MCLITKNKQPRKAIKNITVYKVMLLVDANRGMFCNFWYPDKVVEYFLNVEYTEEMEIIASQPFDSVSVCKIKDHRFTSLLAKDYIKQSEIVIGPGIHSFSSLKRARTFTDNEPDEVRVVECIIPKGAEYYFEELTQSMVSNKIIPIRAVYKEIQPL